MIHSRGARKAGIPNMEYRESHFSSEFLEI